MVGLVVGFFLSAVVPSQNYHKTASLRPVTWRGTCPKFLWHLRSSSLMTKPNACCSGRCLTFVGALSGTGGRDHSCFRCWRCTSGCRSSRQLVQARGRDHHFGRREFSRAPAAHTADLRLGMTLGWRPAGGAILPPRGSSIARRLKFCLRHFLFLFFCMRYYDIAQGW